MLIFEPNFGLANRMRVIASAVTASRSMNKPLRIIWERNNELNCLFLELFNPIKGVVISNKKNYHQLIKHSNQKSIYINLIVKIINLSFGIDYCVKSLEGHCFNKDEEHDIAKLSILHKNIYIRTCGEFGDNVNFFKEFSPIDILQKVIDDRVSRFNAYTIGLHVRRTDHEDAIRESSDDLFTNAINREINLNPLANFYLSTDDKSVEHNLLSIFGSRIIIYEKDFSRNSIKGIQDALIDMYCLGNTSKIYGSYKSSFSDVASRLNNKQLITLS